MDRLEGIKSKKLFEYYRINSDFISLEDIDYLISELERLRTVEQAYQALLSATAGQPK